MIVVYSHLLITASLAALFAVVVVAQSLAAVVRSSLHGPARRERARLRQRALRVADSRA